MTVPCPKCKAVGDEPCISGGYLPIGDLPGDPYLGKDKKPAWHRQRKSANAPFLPSSSPVERSEGQGL